MALLRQKRLHTLQQKKQKGHICDVPPFFSLYNRYSLGPVYRQIAAFDVLADYISLSVASENIFHKPSASHILKANILHFRTVKIYAR